MRKILFILLCLVAVQVEAQVPGDNAITPEKKEDSVAASGDAGVASLFRVNSGAATLAADGDYTTPAVNALGSTFIDANVLLQGSTALGLLKREDAASDDQGAGVAGLIKLQSAISADAAAEDYGLIKGDTGGRVVVTMAPAGETGTSCSAEATGTASTPILSAVASNRWYVTSINCSNNSAVASRVTFLDGAGSKAVGGIGTLAATGGGLGITFDPPIRGSVNTAFNFQMTTTATATICCASGYYSTI